MRDDIAEHIDRLDRLERDIEAEEVRLADIEADDARALADAYRRARSLLEDYRERATGTGDFGGYMEFRSKFSSLVEDLDDGLAHHDAFEDALDHVEQRRLSDRHFDRALDALDPVADITAALDRLAQLRDERSSVRGDLLDVRRDLEQRRGDLVDLADIHPDALEVPVDELRTPIERYNEAVAEAHRSYLKETPARRVVATYRRLSHFALLDIDAPPAELEAYLEDHSVGREPVPTLREYLDYSRSKLDHYVEDAGRFAGEVGPHRPYLEGLTPTPFRIDWPPPAQSRFTWHLRELVQAVDRFGDNRPVEVLRELEALCRDTDRYERLRSAARLRAELDDGDRELVVSGAVHDELEHTDDAIEAIDTALADSG